MSGTNLNAHLLAEIARINRHWRQADAADLLARAETREAVRLTTELAAKIRAGASTGNRIRDFVIGYYATTKGEVVEAMEAMQATLGHIQGEFVLVVEVAPHSWVKDGVNFMQETLSLGVIAGPELIVNLSEGYCAFPTGGLFAEYQMLARNSMTLKRESNLGASFHYGIDFRNLGKAFQEEYPGQTTRPMTHSGRQLVGGRPYLQLEVLIGDRAVLEWIAQQIDIHQEGFHQMMEILGRTLPVPEPAPATK